MSFYMNGFETKHDERKKSFVAFRIQPEKLVELKSEAVKFGIDLSTLIRSKLEGKNE